MTGFNPNDYEDVDTRLHRFYEQHPKGRIITALEAATEDRFIVCASVFRDDVDPRPAATGYAQEVVGSSPVNRTSALENCETSAVGRALANLGLSPKGARPSREEMQKARVQEEQQAKRNAAELDALKKKIRSADSLDTLEEAGNAAKRFRMSDEQRAALRRVYLDRKAELTPAVEEVPA